MKSAAFSYRNSGWNSFEIFKSYFLPFHFHWMVFWIFSGLKADDNRIFNCDSRRNSSDKVQKYLGQEWNEGNIYMFYLGLFWIINIATLFEQPWSSDSDRSNEIFLSFLLTKWNHCINHIMKGMACKKHCQVFTKHIQKKIKWIKKFKN